MPVRVGLVGAGQLAAAHFPAFADRRDLAELVAVVDVSPHAITAVRDRFPDTRAFGSVDEMLAAGDVDAAIVATPHALHRPQLASLMRAGIPTLVEKPAVISVAEMRELIGIQDVTGTPVIVGQTMRFLPEVRAARARIDAAPDEFGPLRSFALQSIQNIGAYTAGGTRSSWFADGRLAGGGATISHGVHRLDILRYLAGADYSRVAAFARYDAPMINGAESDLGATLEMSNGAVGSAQVTYSAVRSPIAESMTLLFATGGISQHVAWDGGPAPLRIAVGPAVAAPSFASLGEDWEDVVSAPDADPPILAELVNLVDVVRGGVPAVTLADNFNTIACIEALVTSASTGRVVDVERL
jgi:predicted dehydrogenase